MNEVLNIELDTQLFDYELESVNGKNILINNAAVSYNSVMEGEYQDWQYIVNTNLLGYMAMAHEAVERMKPNGWGHIVNIGSLIEPGSVGTDMKPESPEEQRQLQKNTEIHFNAFGSFITE